MAIASEIDWDNLPVIDSNTPVGGTGEIDWDNLPVVDDAPAQPAAHSPRMTREERIAANNRAIETARSQEEPGFLSVAGDALAEGAKGAARAVKSIGSGIVGMASGAVRLAGTPVRLATGWDGLHRLADTIDSSYENFGRDALMSEYGENPDGWGYALGRAGEKVAGVAGSLAALGGVGKAVGAAGTALKAAGHAKTAAAVATTLPLMFGNDAAVRAYDTARANGKSKGESAALAGLNGAIHFLGFKAFENKALNKMLGMPAEMEGLMPKWAGEAAEAGGQSFSSLARGVRNGMIKYTLAERGKGALKAGGIMGLQDMLSDPVMQVAEGASIDDIDFSRMLKAGASGLGEGALMEGALGAASVLKSPSEARKFIADKIFRGKDYKVRGSDGKMHDEPGLLNTSEGRMVLMKQNPAATERVLDIVEHGGTPRPAELDAAFLPPDMTAEELKKFASDWRNDLKPYVDEAWAADAPRQTAAPDAAAAKPGRDMLSPEEAQSQQKAANDAAERQKLADRRTAADSMMLDFESWNRLYADGKTDLNFDEWRAAGKPGVIEANLTPKTKEAPTSETRANEAPAQPEQAEVVAPATGAEARPVESAEAPAEAADARVVKPQTAENRTGAMQEGAGARPASETTTTTPAPAKPAEAPSRVSGAENISPNLTEKPTESGKAATEGSAKRRYTKEPLVFKEPYVGKTGAKLTSYLWENKPEEYIDMRGEERTRRVSDWDNAEENPFTRRGIVHQFTVETTDGNVHIVSAETAAKILGVSESTIRTKGSKAVEQAIKQARMRKIEAESQKRDVDNLTWLNQRITKAALDAYSKLADNGKLRDAEHPNASIAVDEDGTIRAWASGSSRLLYKIHPDGSVEESKTESQIGSRSISNQTLAKATPASASSAVAAPVVENRGDAATVAAPESVEAKIAAMKRGSPEQLKAQREYVEREVAKAKDAIKGKFRPKTDRLSPREKAVDAYERVKNTGDIPETVNIKVPGDGEITVKNNPNGMAFLDRFAAKFRPHPTSGESAMALPRSPSIKVSDKPKAESAEKEFAPFVSKDKTRERIRKPYTEGKMVVATDGRVAVRRPLRKGEVVKGADDAPRASQIFDRAKDAATDSAAIDVQRIFPKLQQALALEGSLFVESYEPETGKPTGLNPRATSHAVELWRDADGALQVRSRDTDGNSYASDAWSGDSAPVAVFDGKALVEIMRLAAKNGEGNIEVRFAKDAQNNPVLFSFGGYEAALMPLRAKGHFDEARRVDGESARANPAVSAEGSKAASRVSDEKGAGAQPPSVPAELPAPKSNRLRRADGTDPLAENPMPKTLQKAVYKISSAISNRTGTGVITPEEADGIVRGIVESPETKHNRYRDFFKPLESDAKWHESLGLDSESAKNIRDAFDRVKADADLKKWFPQVDAAVKKANDGRLSKKDAAPLFGKISEGLEKAERMGLSETANRLREAAEVIRPVAETVEQGDVNKFNYSTKGKKLNNRLGGTDKRGNKTVSLDTKDGTVDVRADGKGSTLDGNRHLIIDGVNGDELTVTMKDAAGKTIATRKMNRAQWSALAKGAVATDGDPAAPQKGDLIRMSRNDATDAPPSWTPEAKKPLERVAHALRNVVTVGGKKVKVEFLNERPTNADGQTRKSIGGIFTGSAADYEKPSLHHVGTGEGSQVYGWGLYGSNVRGVAEGYARQGRNLNVAAGDAEYKLDGKSLDRKNDVIDSALTYLASERMNTQKAIEEVNRAIDGFKKQLEDTNERLKWDKNNFRLQMDAESLPRRISHLNEVKGFIERDGGKIRQVLPSENVYEQTFFTNRAPGDESHLLKWYEPVSEENTERIDAISRQYNLDTVGEIDKVENNGGTTFFWGGDKLFVQGSKGEVTGGVLYNLLQKHLGSPKAASEFLARAGIDGVKYPVDSYGGKTIKDGDKAGWNYVSFRDDNIRVDHKWTDGELRYMRNAEGVTVGEYDAAKGEIRLYPGATVADVVHEFTHPLVDFARAEANAGRGELLGKINQIIDAERETWEQPVRDAYKGKSNETILEEIFTHAMGEKGADLFGKSTKTLQGRQWYNRLWEAIKGVWQDFATKIGWNKADLRGLERMSPEDAAQKILSEMVKGRNFGDAVTGGEGTAEARRVVPPPAPTTKDIADWLDGKDDVRRKWRRALQDKNISIRDVEEKLGITDKNESAYYAKDRAFGKNEHELTVLQKQEVEPIVEKIHKSGGDLGLFSAYLYARHAGERNAVLKAEKGVDNGSGMNDAQAKTIFDAVDRLGLRAAFEDAAKDVWAMNRKYLQRRVDAGRMTQAEAKFLMDRYQRYVPLRTDMTNEELDIFNSTTGGWKRNETMTAEGRKNAANDPLAFSIVQNEQAIRASNANEVRRRWAGIVRRSKGELGEIVDGVNKGTAKWAFTFGDGETVETGSPMKLASERDDIILFKENGQLKAIKMKTGEHGRGIELARAVTDKDVAKFNEHLDWIPRATRWMSAMRTQYVPTFIIRNLKADNLEVMLNALSERGLRGENGKSGGVAFFGKFLKNEVSVAKGVREYFKTGKSNDRYVQEAVENGLLTGGGMAAEGFTETARRLSDTLQALRERPKILGGTLKAAKDTISLLNACAEYNTRMGVYKTLREEGMSVADAVSYARDVTVNFNRKGYLTPYTNAAFMFSNAAVQGMGRAFKSMGSEHGKGVIAGLFMVGVAQALLDDWLGHDDEKAKSGGADSRNMTEYDKEHSLGVALPTGHRVKTGIRNPWALPMYAGRKTVELVKGITSGEQAMKDLANAVGGFVTEPVGGNGFGSKAEFLQTIAPTIIDPFVQWGTGKDYKGEDRLKKSFDKTAPQSWNGKERTPEAYKLIAQGLNALTGGSEFRKGWVDSAPEDWQLLAESVFGGVLTDLNNVVKAGGHAVDVARGKPAAQIARDIPFVRDTFTNLPENSNRYYDALEDYERDKAEFKKTTPERRREMKSEKPYLFTGKSLLDGQIERIKELTHLERGEVKVGQKWVEPKTPRTEEQKENYRKLRLEMQARVLKRLGE